MAPKVVHHEDVELDTGSSYSDVADIGGRLYGGRRLDFRQSDYVVHCSYKHIEETWVSNVRVTPSVDILSERATGQPAMLSVVECNDDWSFFDVPNIISTVAPRPGVLIYKYVHHCPINKSTS